MQTTSLLELLHSSSYFKKGSGLITSQSSLPLHKSLTPGDVAMCASVSGSNVMLTLSTCVCLRDVHFRLALCVMNCKVQINPVNL